jgi:hypothetical protein
MSTRSLYGSITTVQVYVPGFRPFAVTLAGSLGPCGEFPMFALLELTHVMV